MSLLFLTCTAHSSPMRSVAAPNSGDDRGSPAEDTSMRDGSLMFELTSRFSIAHNAVVDAPRKSSRWWAVGGRWWDRREGKRYRLGGVSGWGL